MTVRLGALLAYALLLGLCAWAAFPLVTPIMGTLVKLMGAR